MDQPKFSDIKPGTRFEWRGDTWQKVGLNHAKRASDRQTRFVPSEDRVMLAETDPHKQLEPPQTTPPTTPPNQDDGSPQNEGDTTDSDENTTESEENAPDGPGE